MFTSITMFTYIRPVTCNEKYINGIKAPAKVFGLVIIKIPNIYMIVPLCSS